jgi:hypothetical protein
MREALLHDRKASVASYAALLETAVSIAKVSLIPFVIGGDGEEGKSAHIGLLWKAR